MITGKNLDCFVHQLDAIIGLSEKHRLDEISLLRPLRGGKSTLSFVISRKDEFMPVEEASEIEQFLYSLLKADSRLEDISMESRERFKKEYFEEVYDKEIFHIKKGVSREEAIIFIRDRLGFVDYAPSAVPSSAKEEESEPELSSTSTKMQEERQGSQKRARSASSDSEISPSLAKKPTPPMSPTSPPMRPRSPSFLEQEQSVSLSSSANLFVSSSSLSPRKQALLDALLKEFEGEEEQLSAVVQKAIDNKKRIDREQPPLAVVR